jgi:beta-N-acetylhexosaminidase
MTLQKDACDALGELFMIGFSGLELSEDTSAFIAQARIGGVILFAHNYENPGQLSELTNEIQEHRSDLPLWISVDQEGGRVQRFKKGFTRIPDASSISAMDSPMLTFEVAEVIAKELKAVGVNLNFCPVADITTNPKNQVIGNRSFGVTEEIVTKMCTAMLRGHLVHGVQACVKHFPGHGDTSTDSHFALPRVDTSLDVLNEREFKPFIKAFKSKCSMVMTAHILATQLDSQYPATLSKIILQDILRNQLRYGKVIISDDMEMKAIADHFGATDAPRLAVEAGCDILIYRSETAARVAYTALFEAIEKGTLAAERVLEAANRSRELKKEVLSTYQPVAVSEVGNKIGTPEHLAIVQKIEDRNRR